MADGSPDSVCEELFPLRKVWMVCLIYGEGGGGRRNFGVLYQCPIVLPGELDEGVREIRLGRAELLNADFKQNTFALFFDDTFYLLVGKLNHAIHRAGDIGKPMEYFMATGNLVSKSGLGLMQVTKSYFLVMVLFTEIHTYKMTDRH